MPTPQLGDHLNSLLRVVALVLVFPGLATSQLTPFRLTIVRDFQLSTVTEQQCLTGRIYETNDRLLSDPGTLLGKTLELPDRNNLKCISAAPPGVYRGKVVSTGTLGWRIELTDVPGRTNIQIHAGDQDEDVLGCILVGKETTTGPILPRRGIDSRDPYCKRAEIVGSRALTKTCRITDSRDVRDEIRARFGNNDARPIEIRIK